MTSQIDFQKEVFRNKFLIVGGILGVAGLIGICIYKSSFTSQYSLSSKHRIEIGRGDCQQHSEKVLVRVLNSLKPQIIERNQLSSEAIKAIFRSQFELSKKQFKALIIKSRQKRRKVLADIKHYQEQINDFQENIVDLHDKNLSRVLAHFKIDKTKWIEAVNELSKNEDEDWDAFLLETHAEELENIRVKEKQEIQPDILEEIGKYKIIKVKQNSKKFEEISDIQQSDLYSLVEKWAQDQIYMKFNVEIEDINYSCRLLYQHQAKLIEELQDQYCDLMQAVVFGESQLAS